MAGAGEFRIDLGEEFPHLAKAPIVEAVIHWIAKPNQPFVAEDFRKKLEERLRSSYPKIQPQTHMRFIAQVEGDAFSTQQRSGWFGYRLESGDGRYIAQFNQDGLVFSRLKPYEDWARFTAAAKPVWRVFAEIANPVEIQRLGVRFINHLSAATPETLRDFLREPPTCPSNLPLQEFVYQSTFAVPQHPYEIRVIKVLQPSMPNVPQSSGLFLDIDVFTTKPLGCEEEAQDQVLVNMHWLKNKVFFALLTESAVQSFV